MRVLFVSSTVDGGSPRSQRALGRGLVELGHDVRFLVDDGRRAPVARWWYEQLLDVRARWGSRPGRGGLDRVARMTGCQTRARTIEGLSHAVSIAPEHAFGRLAGGWRPDVVVGNSVSRPTWRSIRAAAAAHGVATVLYLREVSAFGHLERMTDPADVLVANAAALADGARQRGWDCELIPSVIDVAPTATASSRTQYLLINPIESHGIELLWRLAERLPDTEFVAQESWSLDAESRRRIEAALADHPNVSFRERMDPGPELYATARLLLVPHRIDNRPRVIHEAQANGIPVLASDLPGLVEATGPGGLVLAPDDVDAWVAAIERLHDPSEYERLSVAARQHAARPELDPTVVVRRFADVLARVADRYG